MAEQPTPPRNAQPDFRTLPAHTGPITALQFISRILDKTGAPNRDKTIDHVSAGDPPVLVASAARAAQRLGWHPKRPSLDEMVGSAWAWRQAHPGGYGN
jgi:UDP-glucose 4-epimerase